MKNKFFTKEYCLIIFLLFIIFSRIYYFILHYSTKEDIFVLIADGIILLFDIAVLLNLVGKAILVSYLLMITSFVGHIILHKYIYFLAIIMHGLVCIILIVESFYNRKSEGDDKIIK